MCMTSLTSVNHFSFHVYFFVSLYMHSFFLGNIFIPYSPKLVSISEKLRIYWHSVKYEVSLLEDGQFIWILEQIFSF